MADDDLVRIDRAPGAPLSAELLRHLADALDHQDDPVDLSDIPLLDDDFWKNAKLSPFYQMPADGMPVRIEPDIALWLRAGGRGFERKLNAILREAMERETAEARPDAGDHTAAATERSAASKRSA